jgi:hypothetical protein
MAAYTGNSQYVPHGPNESNFVIVTHKLVQALAAADTLDLTLPSGVDKDLVPVTHPRVYSTATPSVELGGPANANLAVTNHNRSTGVTRLTAAGAGIAIGADIVLLYTYAAV